MNSIIKELELQGIDAEGGEDVNLFERDGGNSQSSVMNMTDFENYTLNPDIGAVVVGLDTKFTYAKLSIASLYIQT